MVSGIRIQVSQKHAARSARIAPERMSAMNAFAKGRHLPSGVRRYSVVIVSGTKVGDWGSYSTADQALAVALQLRRHGFAAHVYDEHDDRIEVQS